MRARRWSLSGGGRGIGIPDQSKHEVRFINDATIDAGRVRPVAMPDLSMAQTVDPSHRHLWRHRGRSYTAVKRRSYVSVRQGFSEIIAWSEPGEHPCWLYRGQSIPLGISAPQKAPFVALQSVAMVLPEIVTTGVQAFADGDALFYRFVYKTPFGSFAPTASMPVTMAGAGFVRLSFTRGAYAFPIEDILVFRGTEAGKERQIGNTGGAFSFDDLNQAQTSQMATDFDPVGSQLQYAYTFLADGYESAPSKISDPLPSAGSNLVKFDIAGDGFWEQPGLVQLYDVSVGSIRGPLTVKGLVDTGLLYPRDSPGDTWLFGGECQVSLGSRWVSSRGVSLLNADASLFGVMGIQWDPSSGQLSKGWGTRVLDSADFSPSATSFRVEHGGTVSEWSFDGVRGGLRINLGANSLGTGEQVVFLNLDPLDPTKIVNRTVMTAYRAPRIQPTLCWFLGDMGWTWATGQNIAWAREGLLLGITSDLATALKNLEDGTLVRFSSPNLNAGIKLLGRAYLSPGYLFIETDTTGLEGLNLGATNLLIEYFPENNGITARALYRVGDTGEFMRVGEATLGESYLCDSANTPTLGSVLSSATTLPSGAIILDEPPPRGLTNLTLHEGSLAGLDREMVRWTPKGRLHSWPSQFSASIPGARALASTGMGLLVLTATGGVRLDGGTPDAYLQQKTEIEDGILAPLSVANTPFGVAYLGSRGICLTDGHTSRCLTTDRFFPWDFFPRGQAGPDGVCPPAQQALIPAHILDTYSGRGAGWVGFMESAVTREMLARDGILGLVDFTDSLVAREAVGHYFDGSYYLYVPADLAPEGYGSWRLEMATGALFHLGLQPFWMAHEEQDLFLLLPNDAFDPTFSPLPPTAIEPWVPRPRPVDPIQ